MDDSRTMVWRAVIRVLQSYERCGYIRMGDGRPRRLSWRDWLSSDRSSRRLFEGIASDVTEDIDEQLEAVAFLEAEKACSTRLRLIIGGADVGHVPIPAETCGKDESTGLVYGREPCGFNESVSRRDRDVVVSVGTDGFCREEVGSTQAFSNNNPRAEVQIIPTRQGRKTSDSKNRTPSDGVD